MRSRCSERILHRIARVIDKIDGDVDDLEDRVLVADDVALRSRLARFRRQAIGLPRFIAPQREVLGRLQTERVPWLGEPERNRLRESNDRLLRTISVSASARSGCSAASAGSERIVPACRARPL